MSLCDSPTRNINCYFYIVVPQVEYTRNYRRRGWNFEGVQESQEAAAANDQVAPVLRAEIEAELSSAQKAMAEAKGKADQAASDMSQLYANLLSVDAKFEWNKIVHEQTTTDTYTDLQGCTKKGPRGLSHKPFDDCIMFHLLTVFPNNAAEQER
jgi:hypothetical protein